MLIMLVDFPMLDEPIKETIIQGKPHFYQLRDKGEIVPLETNLWEVHKEWKKEI